MIRRLFGKGPGLAGKARRGVEVTATLSEGRFRIAAVGVSHYQRELDALAGGRTDQGVHIEKLAVLLPEPENPHDSQAVAVYLAGVKVGFISRHNASEFQPALTRYMRETQRVFGCRAWIVGGWDRGQGERGDFGVRLCLNPSDLVLEAEELEGEWIDESDAQGVLTGHARGMPAAGMVEGRHYSTYREDVRSLRQTGKDLEAEDLLVKLVEASEREARVQNWGVAPWYYEQLAVMARRRKDYPAEVRILERFASAPHAPGGATEKLLARLDKARSLAMGSSGS